MNPDIDRNLGEQPIARIMVAMGIKPHDVVAASGEQLTHKMVAHAMKGRRLTPKAQSKVLTALNKATGKNYSLSKAFNY